MKDMEYSKKKGMVKQYTNQVEKILNENQRVKNPVEKKHFLGEALEKINLAIETGEDTMVSARAYCVRAKIYKALEDSENAIHDINKAIGLNPDYIELYSIRASFFVEEKRFNDAIKDYTTAFELNKVKDWKSLFEIGNIYFENEEYNNAIEYYTKLIDMFEAPPWVYGKRALAYIKTGKLQEAERDKETANLPEWFFNISPIFYEGVVNKLRSKEPETVRYIPAGKGLRFRHTPNGAIVFGPRRWEWAFDAKTGEFLWHS
jgi:tetratricopeptide (TPR) repeat protein